MLHGDGRAWVAPIACSISGKLQPVVVRSSVRLNAEISVEYRDAGVLRYPRICPSPVDGRAGEHTLSTRKEPDIRHHATDPILIRVHDRHVRASMSPAIDLEVQLRSIYL